MPHVCTFLNEVWAHTPPVLLSQQISVEETLFLHASHRDIITNSIGDHRPSQLLLNLITRWLGQMKQWVE